MAEDDRSGIEQLLKTLIMAKMAQSQGAQQLGGLQAVQQQDPLAGAGLMPPMGQTGSFGRAEPPPRDPSYAPSGRNINFFGGSPFPAQDNTRQLLASLVLGSRVLETINAARKGKKAGTPKAGGTNGG